MLFNKYYKLLQRLLRDLLKIKSLGFFMNVLQSFFIKWILSKKSLISVHRWFAMIIVYVVFEFEQCLLSF